LPGAQGFLRAELGGEGIGAVGVQEWHASDGLVSGGERAAP